MKLRLILISLILLLLPITSIAITDDDISAHSAILIDAATGDVLFEKNIHEKMYPASTTKIMTAILTLENAELDDKVIIDKDTPFTEGNRIYVIEGEVLTVEQLLYALMVESANDAAVALAKHISGTVEDFSILMNKRAKELGALNTNFVNPSGLPDENHVTTSYDLAMIAKHAMTIPKFRELASTVRYQIPPTNKQEETRYLKTSNRFLWGEGGNNKIQYKGKVVNIKYEPIEGIKTGYTLQAQQCLVSSASKDNHRFISVVLKAQGTNIYVDTRTLIDHGLEDFDFIKLTDGNVNMSKAEITNGIEKEVALVTEKELYKAVPTDKKNLEFETIVELQENIDAPIDKGTPLGKATFLLDGNIIGEVNLVAQENIPSIESVTSVYYFDKSTFSKSLLILLISAILFILWRTFVTILRLNRRRNAILRKRKLERDRIRQITYNRIYQYKKR